jgi:hypothetical protein
MYMPIKMGMKISGGGLAKPAVRQVAAPKVKMTLGSMPMIARLSNSVPCGSCGK